MSGSWHHIVYMQHPLRRSLRDNNIVQHLPLHLHWRKPRSQWAMDQCILNSFGRMVRIRFHQMVQNRQGRYTLDLRRSPVGQSMCMFLFRVDYH